LNKRFADGIDSDNDRGHLARYFADYIDPVNAMVRRGYKECTPIYLLNKVSTIVYLLEGLLEATPPDKKTSDLLECLFMFCVVWAFGGPMTVAGEREDYRKNFNEAFHSKFPHNKFPKDVSCLDVFWSMEEDRFKTWDSHPTMKPYTPISFGGGPGMTSFTQLFVPTADTVRLTFLMDTLAKRRRNCMLVGSGSGKTSIINQYLGGLDKDTHGVLARNISMSYYTESKLFQSQIESFIDKRSGSRFGPPPTKRMIIFVDGT
jgi:dynein heavy chain